MVDNATLTIPQEILAAVDRLERVGAGVFLELLAVSLWEKDRDRFGLPSFESSYPDPRKIACSLMGQKGLVARGWLAKSGKLYSLTHAGREELRTLAGDADPSPVQNGDRRPTGLPEAADAELQRLLGTMAWAKWALGEKDSLNFAMACRWWNITENLAGDALDARVKSLGALLKETPRLGVVLSSGRTMAIKDWLALQKLDAYLVDRFSRHLALLRNRTAPC